MLIVVPDSQVNLDYTYYCLFHTILPCSGKRRLAPVSTEDVSDKVGTQAIDSTRLWNDALGDVYQLNVVLVCLDVWKVTLPSPFHSMPSSTMHLCSSLLLY